MPYLLAAQMHLGSESGCLAVVCQKRAQKFILVSEIVFFSFFSFWHIGDTDQPKVLVQMALQVRKCNKTLTNFVVVFNQEHRFKLASLKK